MPRSLLAFLLLAACNGTLKGPCPGGTFNDADRDGFGVEEAGSCEYAADNSDDCDDLHASANPAAAEVVDGLDNDCDGQVDEQDGDGTTTDGDEDGSPAGEDCDDHDNDIHPGAPESCDGVDNNCDNTIDEGVTTTFYADADQDSFGDPATPADACVAPAGYTSDQSDCDDSNNAISPLLSETCDGIDNNCNGQIDEGVLQTFYVDADGDGYPGTAQTGCDAGANAATSTDVDDTDATVWPGAPEIADGKDNDGDGEVDEDISATDDDGDGYSEAGGDCDDTSAAYNPGTPEICDGYDNNCDGQIDEGLLITFYADADGDGYGDASRSINACSLPAGYAANSVDPDDTNAGITPTTDADGDGDPDANDCSPADARVFHGAPEFFNGVDDDCDGVVDNATLWRPDCDSDGYGDDAQVYATTSSYGGACTLVDGTQTTDCDDGDATVSPVASEICDGIDNDCDGDIDDADANLDTTTASPWFRDVDDDGYGYYDTADDLVYACSAPTEFAANGNDCDDGNTNIFPAAAEICDGLQNDCTLTTWTTADEYGLVSYVHDDGVVEDYTGILVGTSTNPTRVTLSEDGVLNFCADAAGTTWYVNLSVASGRQLRFQGLFDGDPALARTQNVLSGADAGTVITGQSGADLTIWDLTITEGSASIGGGVYGSSGDVDIQNTTFTANTAVNYGSAVYVFTGTLQLADVDVEDGNPSQLDRAYGAVMVSGAVATMDRVSITNNYVTCALFNNSGVVTLRDSDISNNTSGTGIRQNLYGTGGSIDIFNTTIRNNQQGLDLESGTATLDHVEVSGNTIYGYGAGIYASAETLSLRNGTRIENNVNSLLGGGLYAAGSTITIDSTSGISSNYAPYGGGVYLSGGTMTVDGGSITDNTGTVGAGIYLVNYPNFSCQNTGDMSGNIAITSGGSAYLYDGSISSNTCSWEDIYVLGTASTWTGLGAVFTCTNTGC